MAWPPGRLRMLRMRVYVLSLTVGLLVGIIYGLMNIRSPAPPVVALLGLLGMLLGEQIVPMAKRLMAGHSIHVDWLKSESLPHVFGHMPKVSPAIPHETKEEHTDDS
jgi:XapX domain-containing protein